MAASRTESLRGLRVVSFESRRAKEMAELIRRYGGEAIVAPSVREVPLSENRAVIEFLPEIEGGRCDLLVLLTGVGTRALYQILRTEYDQERTLAALRRVSLIARGPKPVAVLKELGLEPALTVPEPNTWRELLAALDAHFQIGGKRVAVQEYGIANADLIAALAQRGALVKSIAVYHWALPEDLAPLRSALQTMLRGGADVALFTNGAQIEHLFRVAAAQESSDKLRLACQSMAIGSVGPICSQVLRQFGLQPDIEPGHPKMGFLMAEVAASAAGIVAAKRARRVD